MNALELIYSKLEAQRETLLRDTQAFRGLWDRDILRDFLESMVFSDDDHVEMTIKGICDIQDLEPLNELRDYQHGTIDLCLEAWDKVQP